MLCRYQTVDLEFARYRIPPDNGTKAVSRVL
jgi:hypothetical protein